MRSVICFSKDKWKSVGLQIPTTHVRFVSEVLIIYMGDWCNGSKRDFDSRGIGSIPLSLVIWRGGRIGNYARLLILSREIGMQVRVLSTSLFRYICELPISLWLTGNSPTVQSKE